MQNLLSNKANDYFKLYPFKKIIWASKKTFGFKKDDHMYMSRAITYNKLQKHEKAISACREAIYMNPNKALLSINLWDTAAGTTPMTLAELSSNAAIYVSGSYKV